ncbi:MAG: hypothetical protein ACD_49C00020G0007 [uncultured bacterium (gcode 4)]|uniref:Uncharacterized protein n=1 Tax=uncultured bacterium (gcode 4) TaxID=1234023 RepID=K2AYB6_9BACT|nr:MAG: hypothetical protein ACD_49C00020G0007 [uncultured bacterium (gcode 4)]
MTKVVEIKDYFPVDFIELPIIKAYDMPLIQGMRNKIWIIVGKAFIEEIIWIAQKWKNILSEKNISANSLPYNIEIHLKQVKETEKQELADKINSVIKLKLSVKIKKQLLHLRNKILQNNIQN